MGESCYDLTLGRYLPGFRRQTEDDAVRVGGQFAVGESVPGQSKVFLRTVAPANCCILGRASPVELRRTLSPLTVGSLLPVKLGDRLHNLGLGSGHVGLRRLHSETVVDRIDSKQDRLGRHALPDLDIARDDLGHDAEYLSDLVPGTNE